MTTDYTTFCASDLLRFATRAFLAFGLSEEDAQIAADHLITADVRGTETHGLLRLPLYSDWYKRGVLNPRAKPKALREGPSTLLVDGDHGIGLVTSPWTMRRCMEKAKRTGCCVATCGNTGHNGAVGQHAMLALEHDMIGMASTGGGTRMAPTYGTEGIMGLNPIAVAAPAAEECPFVMDITTAVVAGGKLDVAAMKGLPIPLGWARGGGGDLTTDAQEARRDGVQLPLGCTPELGSHKGYALSFMLEIFCNLLAGMTPSPVAAKDPDAPRTTKGHFFAAWRIDHFQPVDAFKAMMDRMIRAIRASEKEPGRERIFTPGEREFELAAERRAHGIPLHRNLVNELRAVADEWGLEFP